MHTCTQAERQTDKQEAFHISVKLSCLFLGGGAWKWLAVQVWLLFFSCWSLPFFKMLWTDINKIPQHIFNFTGSESSVFKDKFVHSAHIFTHFACQLSPQCLAFSTEVTPLLNIKNRSNLCSSHFLLPKSYLQHFEGFCCICSWFKAKFYVQMLFFKVCNFLHMPQS